MFRILSFTLALMVSVAAHANTQKAYNKAPAKMTPSARQAPTGKGQMDRLQKPNAPMRKTANARSFEIVNIHYTPQAGSAKVFKDLSLNLTPFGNFISFSSALAHKNSPKAPIQMDCYVSDDATKWNCLSSCEGGKLTIAFHEDTSFSQIRIAPFKIRDRACDGNESEDDRVLSATQALVFQIDKMRMSQ
ncbi:MAG: hypothetical protein M9899_07455 [Bdellovibrionaceae bacterium]|nr:hypothetical protein [Pseudobdellovibrionaceae bacterium]